MFKFYLYPVLFLVSTIFCHGQEIGLATKEDQALKSSAASSTFFEDIKTKDIVSDNSIKWIQFGPGMSGNNKSAFWHPTDPNVLFIGPNMGNSYRSTDKGLTYETIMDEDGPGHKTGMRGPLDATSFDFSRQSPNRGFCTDKKNLGIFQTWDKGKTWTKQKSSLSTFGRSYLSSVAVNPKDDAIWYVGGGRMRDMGRISFTKARPHGILVDANSQGKIWKSTDRGATWTLKNSGLNPKAEIESIVVDPVNTNIVYATTNYGFYKSTNGGNTWVQKTNGLDHDVFRSFDIHHNKSNNEVTLYALVNVTWKVSDSGKSIVDSKGGVFKSTDRGESWKNIDGNLAINMKILGSDSQVKKQFYHNVGHYFGITDSEAASKYPDLPTSITIRFNQIEVDPNNPDNIFLANEYSNFSEINFKPGSIYSTSNGGQNWNVIFRNGKNWNSGPHVNYWTGRGNTMGTNVNFKYLKRWENRDTYDRKGCNFIKFNANGTILHTQLAKISLMSYDKGKTWVDIDDEEVGLNSNTFVGAGNSNVPGHGFYQHPLISNKVFCAGGENGLWITSDGGATIRPGAQAAKYKNLLPPNEVSLSSYAIHPTNTNIHYALFFRQHGGGKIYRSTNNGATFVEWGTPIPKPWPPAKGDQSVHQLSLLFDPNDPDTMYFCVPRSSTKLEWVGDSVTGWGVHKSTDKGKTWSKVNNGLPASLDVSRLAFDPNSSNTLYATVVGNNGGLYKTVNNGRSWSKVASTSSISGTSGINDIHFDKDGKVYITAGFINSPANEGGLWVSNNNMRTWTKKFDYPWVNRVEVAKYNTDVILLSTLANSKVDFRNAGTYLSKDGGNTWIKINKGNGQSDRVNDIAIDYTIPGKYYASTRGSGWYVATDPQPNSAKKSDVSSFQIEESKENIISVYPNPVKETLSFKNLSDDNHNLTIYTIDGQLIMNTIYKNTPLDVSHLKSEAVYFYTIQDGGQRYSGRFIKK
ncbi:hypothetical protein B4Q04_09385 [Zobellia sp. OII3]|uniref:VPS10 domain-containing protein n=1 Tax=Zobellia sp. OII3 TaxID=2034520 RepID=UPI000B53248E|nr:T9SS type A sorting domain-containing protein [Zobellia sp. OII3]OWW25797.1 hypothetical protein B4Q04_09385 [Zobellia sp. OII3]